MDCSRKSSFTPPHSLSVQHPVHHKNVYEKKKKKNVYGLYSLVSLQACNTAWAATFSCLPHNGGHIVSIPAPSPYLTLFGYLLQASHRVKSHEASKDKKGSPKGR